MAKRISLDSIKKDSVITDSDRKAATGTKTITNKNLDKRLSGVSRNIEKFKKTEYVSINDIIKNPKNEYSMQGIEVLANLIELSGLEQPLVVRPSEADEPGRYMLMTGHRRYEAINLLISQNKWNEDGLVEVKIKNLEDMKLPVSRDVKETLSILTTNETRNFTDGDRLFRIKEWNKVINELRKSGIEVAEINGLENPIVLKGVGTREIISEQLNISTGTIGTFNKIESKGCDELLVALKEDTIALKQANRIASYPKEEQKELLSIIEESRKDTPCGKQISAKEVDEGIRKIKGDLPQKKSTLILKEQLLEKYFKNGETKKEQEHIIEEALKQYFQM